MATIEHVYGVTNGSLANDEKHLNSFSTKQNSLDSRDPFNGFSGKATNISQTNGSPTITLPLNQGRRIWRKRGHPDRPMTRIEASGIRLRIPIKIDLGGE